MNTQQKYNRLLDLYFTDFESKAFEDLDDELSHDPAFPEIWDASIKENRVPIPVEFSEWAIEQSKGYKPSTPISPQLMKEALSEYYDEAYPLSGGVIEIMKYGWDKEKVTPDWVNVLDIVDALLNKTSIKT